jgi:hypothetical protein
MTRRRLAVGAAVVAVAAVLLGAWLLRGTDPAAPARPAAADGPAPTTTLRWAPQSSGGADAPEAYPKVPAERVDAGGHGRPGTFRTDRTGGTLFVPVVDMACSRDEARLLGEYPDHVDVEIRTVAKPPPPGVSIAPDGGYSCAGVSIGDGPHAVIALHAPLADRRVVVRR